MDPAKIAQIVAAEMDKRLELYAKRAWYRGEVTAVNGSRVDVKIEGQTTAMPNLLCINSYSPIIGDIVLIANIGTTGSNFVVMGMLDVEEES